MKFLSNDIEQIVENYLAGKLSVEEVAIFEKELTTNIDLQVELDIQKNIKNLLVEKEIQDLRTQFLDTISNQEKKKKYIRIITITIAATIAVGSLLVFSVPKSKSLQKTIEEKPTKKSNSLNKKEKEIYHPITIMDSPTNNLEAKIFTKTAISKKQNIEIIYSESVSIDTIVANQVQKINTQVVKNEIEIESPKILNKVKTNCEDFEPIVNYKTSKAHLFANDGKIEFNKHQEYQFSIQEENLIAVNGTFDQLAKGKYIVTIKDGNCGFDLEPITIDEYKCEKLKKDQLNLNFDKDWGFSDLNENGMLMIHNSNYQLIYKKEFLADDNKTIQLEELDLQTRPTGVYLVEFIMNEETCVTSLTIFNE